MLLASQGTDAGEAPSPVFRWRRWFVTVTVGETVGFLVPGAAWGLAWMWDLPPLALYLVVVTAGIGEGVILGWAQASNLRPIWPGLAWPWVLLTGAGAAVAWAMGMAPPTLHEVGIPAWMTIVLGVAVVLPLLASIGVAQWILLRRRVSRAWRWIAANIAAWVAALPITFIAPALVPGDAPWYVWAIAFLGAGITMAAILAAITGRAMVQLLRERAA